MNEEAILVQLDRDKVESKYDVLMDGYTFYAGIRYYHEAAALAAELVEKNPLVHIEVRKIETHTQWIKFWKGVPQLYHAR